MVDWELAMKVELLVIKNQKGFTGQIGIEIRLCFQRSYSDASMGKHEKTLAMKTSKELGYEGWKELIDKTWKPTQKPQGSDTMKNN